MSTGSLSDLEANTIALFCAATVRKAKTGVWVFTTFAPGREVSVDVTPEELLAVYPKTVEFVRAKLIAEREKCSKTI